MFADYTFVQRFIFYGKIAGGAISFGTLVTIFYQKLISPVVSKVVHINDTVAALATNHLPHIQDSLNQQDKQLEGIRSDMMLVNNTLSQHDVRLEQTKGSIETLHADFMRHIETGDKRKKKVKV